MKDYYLTAPWWPDPGPEIGLEPPEELLDRRLRAQQELLAAEREWFEAAEALATMVRLEQDWELDTPVLLLTWAFQELRGRAGSYELYRDLWLEDDAVHYIAGQHTGCLAWTEVRFRLSMPAPRLAVHVYHLLDDRRDLRRPRCLMELISKVQEVLNGGVQEPDPGRGPEAVR